VELEHYWALKFCSLQGTTVHKEDGIRNGP